MLGYLWDEVWREIWRWRLGFNGGLEREVEGERGSVI